MHIDLEKIIARRLHAAADEPGQAPYEWAEFKRRQAARSALSVPRRGRLGRTAAMAAGLVMMLLVAGIVLVRSGHRRTPAIARAEIGSSTYVGGSGTHVSDARNERSVVGSGAAPDHLTQARTRAIEGWLADLPRDRAVVRVGAGAAVTSLQDQIAELDDLMSAERVAGGRQVRLDALERQRAQLVSSLAQLQYAEMLASASR